MALLSSIGKIRLKGFGFPKFGVRGSLFAAFAVIAGMAIVISAGAGLVLGHLGGAITDLSGRDIPRLAASLQLSAESASLASQGPGLLASRSEEISERTRQEDAGDPAGHPAKARRDHQIRRQQGYGVGPHRDGEEHRGHDQEPRWRGPRTAGNRRPARKALCGAAHGAGRLRQGRRTRDGRRPDPAQRHLRRRRFLPGRGHQGGENRRAARRHRRRRQSDGVQHDGSPFVRKQRHARSHREADPQRAAAAQIESRSAAQEFRYHGAAHASTGLQALGEGKTGVFKVRQKELDAADYGQTILEETRKLNVGLGISVQQLVDGVRGETDASTSRRARRFRWRPW